MKSDVDLLSAGPLGTDLADKTSSDKRLIWALSLASVLIYINLYLMQGMLPSIAEQFHVSAAQSTLVLSITSFSLAFSLLFYAILSDRVGRRTPILVSLWCLAISNLLLILATDFSALIAVRLLQGVLLASVPAIAMAYFKERLSAHVLLAAAATYIAANSLGGILGRLLGGLMSQYLDWQQSMQMLCAVTFLGVASVSYLIAPDSVAVCKPKKRQSWRRFQRGVIQDLNGFVHHLKDSQMRFIYLIGGLAFMVMVNQFSFIQLHLMAAPFHWSRFEATLIFLCYLSGTYASYRSAKWITKWGPMPLFRLASVLMILGSLLTLLDTEFFICFGFLVSACGFFSIHSGCNSSVAIRAQHHRAKATSLYLCCYYLGASLGGPYLMPFWHQAGWLGVVFGSLCLLAVMLLLVWRLGCRLPNQQPAH